MSGCAIGGPPVPWLTSRSAPPLATCALKHGLAALVDGFAAASLDTPQQLLHVPDLPYKRIEFGELLARELSPTLRDWRRIAKPEEEFTYFIQAEPRLARPLHDRQPVEGAAIVPSLATHALRWPKNSNLFVIADGGSANPNLARYFGDRHVGHARMISEFLRSRYAEETWDQLSETHITGLP